MIVAIVQARVGSTRFPRKVLTDISGATMLERVVERVREARSVERVVVATTTATDDSSSRSSRVNDGLASASTIIASASARTRPPRLRTAMSRTASTSATPAAAQRT